MDAPILSADFPGALVNNPILLSLVQNAALLLLIVYLYELAFSHLSRKKSPGGQVVIGIGLGLVGVAIMASPLYVTDGLFFDARTVLTGIAGLFFGWLPTVITMAMTAAFRFHLGGAGAWGGVGTLVLSGCLGLLWRRWRRDPRQRIGLRELYLFGVMASGLSLLLLVLVLGHTTPRVQLMLEKVALPFMLTLPVATALLGMLIGDRIESRQQGVALEKSEAHLQALYQYAPVALWKEDWSAVKIAMDEIRSQGNEDIGKYLFERPGEIWRLAALVKVLDVNEACLAQIGATSVEHFNASIDHFFNEEGIAAFGQQLAQMADGQTHYQGESSFVRLDGEVRHVVVSLYVQPGHEESYDLIMVSTLDITENKNYATEIKESYRLLTSLTDSVPGVMFQYEKEADGVGHYPFVSKGVRNIYELTQEEVNVNPSIVFERIHPDDRSSVLASIEYSERTLEPWHDEYRVNLPTRGERWVAGDATPERQADGTTLWHGYVRDITERKHAEARVQLGAQVFEASGEAIMITDANAKIIAVNPAFARITGYSEEEIKGRSPNVLASGRHDETFYSGMWASLRATGNWAGDIWNRRKNGEVYPEWLNISAVCDEHGRTQYYVAVFSDLTEIHRAQILAERLALEDAMTGLGNRGAFTALLDKRISELAQPQRYAAVMLFDILRFKEINESRGLMFGDQVLKELAGRLRDVLGLEHFVARVGADEFAILMVNQSTNRDEVGRLALELGEQLRLKLNEPLRVGNEEVPLHYSVGMVVFPDAPGDKAADVLQQADWAVRQSLEHEHGEAVFFQTVMGQQIRERYRLEQELRLAPSENQLRMYMQPQVNAAGRQVSAEALIRWEHPQNGLVPPGMFIPLAEASELIFELERWMLQEVCQLLVQLDKRGKSLKIAINISAKHFQRDGFVDEVRRQITLSGANPALLVFEITESIIIDSMAEVTAKMAELASMGIHFSLDDFGTGYSSLSYLKRLPIHELKIDRSFIMDAPTSASDAALVETMLGVARTLGLQVVAEGVETQAQADFLKARGDVIHQGYLYDKPMPVADWLVKYIDK